MSTVAGTPGNTDPSSGLVQEIRLDQIRPSKANRRCVDDTAKTELAEIIKGRGGLQAILVRPTSAGGYKIVYGERAWRASKTAGVGIICKR